MLASFSNSSYVIEGKTVKVKTFFLTFLCSSINIAGYPFFIIIFNFLSQGEMPTVSETA